MEMIDEIFNEWVKAKLQRGHDFSAMEIDPLGFFKDAKLAMLQWGHDFSAMEICLWFPAWFLPSCASMGP